MGKDFSEVRWIVQTRVVPYNTILDVSRDSVRKVYGITYFYVYLFVSYLPR